MQSILDVADNTGARSVMCIKVLAAPSAAMPALATSSRSASRMLPPRGRVKKGEVYNAVVVRTAKGVRRPMAR